MGNIDIYRKFLNKTGFNILKIKDFSNEIPRNYKYALSNLESNKEKIIERFGKTEYLNTWNFYSYCLSETIQKNVGWAMFVCKKE